MPESFSPPAFFARVAMAFIFFFRILFRPSFAQQVLPYRRPPPALPSEATGQAPVAEEPPAEKAHASGLFVLSMLQREGRFIDFLQEDIAAFPDAEVGAAARVVHEGCRKVVRQYLSLEPVLRDPEGAPVTVPNGFDAQRIRLTGNVAGQPPFRGALRHHGWMTTSVRLPHVPEAMDPRVIAPAEVELG
ncbi:MAG TPA: DUF2760 domain-containing protein [Myxococcaceae bacterium]|jgi:hypothetical protein|nr:DUF2760 domain-containing protein [Myxococcaceae bacterium]